MTISYITSVKKQGTSTGSGTSGAIDTTGADFLVAIVCYATGVTAPTIADSKSNGWGSAVVSKDNGVTTTQIYIVVAPTVGSGHTFSANGTETYAGICVAAYSGVKQTAPTDQTSSGQTASNTTVVQPGTQSGNDTGGITPSEDNCLLVYAASDAWDTSLSASSGNTRQTAPIIAGTSFALSLFDEIQTTATARNPVFTEGGAATRMSAVIASFKAASTGGAKAAAVYYHTMIGSRA